MRETFELRKARGAYFTPPEIARVLTSWAIRSPTDNVLEPSCGEASILLQAGLRLRDLGGYKLFCSDQLHGIEIHGSSAQSAKENLARVGIDADIRVTNFFDEAPDPIYDAIVGNPPFIRYQQFAGTDRVKGIEAALANGVRLPNLTSSWAPFVIHSAQFLKPNGRLALVLPAELLTVNYASNVRRFLLNRFRKLRLVLFEKRVFPDVLTEVMLLLAEGTGGATSFEVYEARNILDVLKLKDENWKIYKPNHGEKWTSLLLNEPSLKTYRDFCELDGFDQLLDWGRTYLGSVTGNNNFFSLNKADVEKFGLEKRDLLKISPPGSRHLRGLRFSPAAWATLAKGGYQCFLFNPHSRNLSSSTSRYVARGRRYKVNHAYKCQNRTPWWQVPLVKVPDLFLTYMNHERPRLIWNEAQVHILNSVYGVALNRGMRTLGRELLPIASLNSVTLLGAEVVGRSYGGGLMKLEPREADLIPMPTPDLLKDAEKKLRNIRPQLATFLRSGDLEGAVKLVDEIILVEALEATPQKVAELRHARALMFKRRKARSQKNNG